MSPQSGNTEDRLEYGQPFDDDQLVKWFFNRRKEAVDFFEAIWAEGSKCFEMYAGASLSDTDKDYLTQTKRPIVEFPFAKGIIDTIIGAEMSQRTEPVFHGQDESAADNIMAELITETVRYIRSHCDSHRQETEAYFDMLVTGYGFCDGHMDLSKPPFRPRVKHGQVWNFYPDPDATEDNLSDARYFIREVDWDLEQIQARWPDKVEDIEAAISTKKVTVMGITPRPQQSGRWVRGTISASKSRATIYEFQYCRDEPRVVYFDPNTQERVDASKAECDKKKKEIEKETKRIMGEFAQAQESYEAQMAMQPPPEMAAMMAPGAMPPPPQPPAPPQTPAPIEDEANYAGKVWYRAFILGAATKSEGIVLENQAISINEPTIKCVTGFKWKHLSGDNAGRVRFFGVMRVIYDAQVYLTRALQTYLEILMRGSKGGGFVGRSALGKMTPEQFAKERATPGAYTILDDAAFGPTPLIKDNPPQTTPTGFEGIYRMCIEALGLLTGVMPALQGTITQTDRTSNILVSNLQESGMQMLLPIREPRTAFTVQLGRLIAAIALKHLPAGELDRILGKREIDGLTHDEDPTTGEFIPRMSQEIDRFTQQPKPVTVGMLLKQEDLLAYDTVADVGSATPTQKLATWQMFATHGLLETFLNAGVPPDILLPPLVANSPLPGTISKEMADKLGAFFKQQKLANTTEGTVNSFQELAAQDPDGAGQLLQQLGGILEQAQGQAPSAPVQ